MNTLSDGGNHPVIGIKGPRFGESMIVKVQLPLAGEPKALIYNRGRSFETMFPISAGLRKKMRDRPKAFFEADIEALKLPYIEKFPEMLLKQEVPDPGW